MVKKNSIHLVENICKAPVYSNQMVSQDVINLFTRVPNDETLTVVWDKFTVDP